MHIPTYCIKLRSMKKLSVILISMMMLLASCTVTETIDVTASDSGKSTTDVQVEQFFIDVLYSFADFLPEENADIMGNAVADLSSQLESLPSVESPSIETVGENHYRLSFDFTDIAELITDLGISEQSIFSIGDNSFSFYLDINNYPELKTFLPFLSDPNFDVYGPEYNQGMSEADYLEMMSFLLGEEAPDAITNSQITIQLNVPGTISENVNAEVIDSDTVSFTFPLVKFLLLSEPIEFSASWS